MEVLTSNQIFPKIEEIVSSAQKDVKIASAWIKGTHFEKLIEILKTKKDVNLEVILRASEFQDLLITDDRIFKKIKEVNGKVYLSNRLHAKFIIVDNSMVIVGSANLTDAGLSDVSSGNIEAGVFYTVDDDEKKVKEIVDYFEDIKKNFANEFGEDLIGFALNPVKPQSFEFIVIKDEVNLQSYVEVRLKEETLFARVTSIYAYDMGFFANPFTSYESKIFAPIEDFKKIFSDGKDEDWKKAAAYAYINGNGNRVKIAVADVVGVVKDGKLDMVKKPFNVGEAVYRASKETLKDLMKKNFSGRNMDMPVRIGKLQDTDIDAFVDAGEIVNKHMLVIGTTGSGKSYFVKKFLCDLIKQNYNVQIFIFDPHGEYYEELKKCIEEEKIENIVFDDTLLPVYPEELEELIKNAGYGYLVSGNSGDARNNKDIIRKHVKPSIRLTKLGARDILSILKELRGNGNEDLINSLKEIYGEGTLKNQSETIKNIERGVASDKNVVILDFRNVTNSETRVNIAGLIMQELFNQNKQNPDRKRLIVLEEAHNFAPEKGYGDVSAGKDNLALTMARKIASEGRKFNLGLITITQRPAQVSKYVLSQMNTQAMFRTINNADIETISTYVEYTGKDIIDTLPSLPTGKGIISGMGVPFPEVVSVE
ncbi:DUF87 domain-containing protein [Aquifex pyrophilus]